MWRVGFCVYAYLHVCFAYVCVSECHAALIARGGQRGTSAPLEEQLIFMAIILLSSPTLNIFGFWLAEYSDTELIMQKDRLYIS